MTAPTDNIDRIMQDLKISLDKIFHEKCIICGGITSMSCIDLCYKCDRSYELIPKFAKKVRTLRKLREI